MIYLRARPKRAAEVTRLDGLLQRERRACEVCQGDGQIKVEMHFLPDFMFNVMSAKVRYNRETLEILYKGKTIADVLNRRRSAPVPRRDPRHQATFEYAH